MMKKIAYEMSYDYAIHEQSSISCEPFDKHFFQEYMRIYNECFYEMRKAFLLFGMQQIRRKNNQPIKLHVAEWNQHAFNMYKKVGFEVTRIEQIR